MINEELDIPKFIHEMTTPKIVTKEVEKIGLQYIESASKLTVLHKSGDTITRYDYKNVPLRTVNQLRALKKNNVLGKFWQVIKQYPLERTIKYVKK